MAQRAASVIMPILVRKKYTRSDSGFSLLEMLVVLAIMAVALSIVGASMMRSIDATRFDRSADAAIASLLTLRADAMLASEARVIIPDNANSQIRNGFAQTTQRRLALPNGWRVEGDVIHISPSGICKGGAVRLYNGGGRFRDYALLPPKCAALRAVAGT